MFKIQKINLRNEKQNFLNMLNKPTEEVNKEKINENENGNDFDYYGRFNFDDLEEVEEKEINTNIENIDIENEKINEDSTPDMVENKIYHVDYNKIEDNNNINDEDNNNKNEDNNINNDNNK